MDSPFLPKSLIVIGLFIAVAQAPVAVCNADPVVITKDGHVIRRGCGRECATKHADGLSERQQSVGVVASPTGTTYSVHHRVGADLANDGSDEVVCVSIANPASSEDDIVNFDGITETIRPDILGTVPEVGEVHEYQSGGTRFIQINTASQNGADLFPGNFELEGEPLTDACFIIGLDDPLDWEGLDAVSLARISFLVDGTPIVGPVVITQLFSNPWDGHLSVTVANGAGLGINGVELELLLAKDVDVPNDDCQNRIPVTDGSYSYTTAGATTDGVPHPQTCAFFGYTDVGADIWYEYTATCTGELTVDLCDSDYDTKVAVYEGCGRCPPTVEPIACNDDFCLQQSFLPYSEGEGALPVVEGSCYSIRVGGFQSAQGEGTMRLKCHEATPEGACCSAGLCTSPETEADCVALGGDWYEGEDCTSFSCPNITPPHDECDQCIPVQTDVPFMGSTVNATGEDITSCGLGDVPDIWHCWTADCTGLTTIETCGSSYDTTLAVFEACDGNELRCVDEGCGVQSRIPDFIAHEGTTYYIRVSGYQGETGQYEVLVSDCRSACCTPEGQCVAISREQCLSGGGLPQVPGTFCSGDGNGNMIDDTCEACSTDPTIIGALPGIGTIDARQPHDPGASLPRQGLGTPDVPILLAMVPQRSGLDNCFALCETDEDSILGANGVDTVTGQGGGVYKIVLDHAIAADAVTTIEYAGNGSFAHFTAHPGNVNGSSFTNTDDVFELLDCCLDGPCTPARGAERCDIDRSTVTTPLDLLRLMDLLVGVEQYSVWNGTSKPVNSSCPP